MSQLRFTRAPGITAVAALASFWAVTAQAGPAQTIYSAENALYGAGHEIGKADGWMDNTLRAAIRRYQSSDDELQVTGNLDPETLKALGVAPEGNNTISDNAVGDRKSAMAALGLSDEQSGSGSAGRTIAAAPEPAKSEPAKSEPAEIAEIAEIAETEPEPEIEGRQKAADTEPAASTAAEPEASPTRALVAESEPEPEPEVTAQIAEPAPETRPEPKPEPEPATADEEVTVEISTVEEVAKPSPATNDRSAPGSSGGFFSSLFDFLFGWLI